MALQKKPRACLTAPPPSWQRGRAVFWTLLAAWMASAVACGGERERLDPARSVAATASASALGFDMSPPFVAHEIPMRDRGLARRPRVLLDAGHGAHKNPGNTSSFGQEEQDFTRLLAYDIRDAWDERGLLEPLLTREDAALVPYPERVGQSRHADYFISLHSDVRGTAAPWSPVPGRTFLFEVTRPGFVVIFSDEGEASVVNGRRKLAIAISRAMKRAGFVPYLGGYAGLYDADPEDAAVLVDRHEPRKRIYLLRAATVPAVLVETHHALDPREAMAWEDDTTRRAFAEALGDAILERAADAP